MGKYKTASPTDEEILAYDKVPTDIAARYIGMSTSSLYDALQQERVSFGFAVENKETKTWTYNISPGGLVKYKREGCPIIRLGDLRQMLTDFVREYIDAKLSGLSKVLQLVANA